jgi:tRNA-splicing ligase RtcB
MKVMYKNEMKIPAKIWVGDLSEIESGALDQAELVCSQEWAARAAFMPDMHLGKGCTIGAVIGTKNTLIPNLVGVN